MSWVVRKDGAPDGVKHHRWWLSSWVASAYSVPGEYHGWLYCDDLNLIPERTMRFATKDLAEEWLIKAALSDWVGLGHDEGRMLTIEEEK